VAAKLVDIHTHLLPGIDDGPSSLEKAVEMVRVAWTAGATTLAATPHLRPDFPLVHVREIADRCHAMRQSLEGAGIHAEIVSGAEVSVVWALEASDEQRLLASYGQKGQDLLIETPSDVTMLDRLLYPLLSSGFRITLAHPSRSVEFQREPKRMERLKEQGVLLQVNAESLLAPRTSPVRKTAEYLCRSGLGDVIASDGHRAASWRPVTSLGAAVEAASLIVGRERAEWMASSAPRAVLDGNPLPEPPPLSGRRRSPFAWRRD
jgi:protein-tyrosine phosphatase